MESFKPMEPLEPREPVPQESAAAEEMPVSGYYHGAGVGHRENLFESTPYYNYDPYGSAHIPEPEPVPEAEKPRREKRHVGKKIFSSVGLLIAAVALVVGSCYMTAGVTSLYWKRQYNNMKQNLREKLDVQQEMLENMQHQLDAMQQQNNGGAGDLTAPEGSLTASQIYQQNVNSVVAVHCAVGGAMGTSAGTGFIITEDGFIITNHHVIDNAASITVVMADGSQYPARLIGSDATNDVAVVKIDRTGLDPVTLGSSSALVVGDQVVAIGNALGELSSSLTVGYISGMDRDVSTDGTVINMIQTDVAINSGNSGGPLFNARGEVIGITTAKYSGATSTGASIEGISFAIPINDALEILPDLVEYGYVKSAYLGIYAADVDEATAQYYGFPVGVYVSKLEPGLCAAKAGLQPKDIIVEIAGYEISGMTDLSRALRKLEPGETVSIVVWRSGQEVILTITLDERPQE